MERTSYATYVVGKGKEYSYEFKCEAVFAAGELGIKPTARKFRVSRNTIRSWLRRLKTSGKTGLQDRRCGPNKPANKTPWKVEERVVAIRQKVPCYGPIRMKYFFEIPCSIGAIRRIIRTHNLTRRRKKSYQKRRDLRAVKAKRSSMTFLQMDVKYLNDIPTYWEQLKPLGLPKFQYTIRDSKSGMLFLGYSDELSELNARTMVDYIITELKLDLPFDIKELNIQTDNGTEFSGLARSVEKAPFVQMIEKHHGANHVYIRPGHCNANADVESSHELIETEFYDLTKFSSRADFLKKAESYRLFFNFVRPNFSKGVVTPQKLCELDWSASVSYNYGLIRTVDLDTISCHSQNQGQSFPSFAGGFGLLQLISIGRPTLQRPNML